MVDADTVNAFKYRLDKHRSNQDLLFDFNDDLTEIGKCTNLYVIVMLCKMQTRTTCARQNTLDWNWIKVAITLQ